MFRDRPDWSSNLGDLQRQMERFLDYLHAGKRPQFPISASPWQPAVDVAESSEHITVTVEISGVEPDDIQILVEGTTLIIRGVRRRRRTVEHCVYHVMEIGTGPFERIIRLPRPVDAEKSDASYVAGMLQIDMPRLQTPSRSNRVIIQTGR